MSYTLNQVSDSIILQKIIGDYTASELANASHEMATLIDKQNQSCYILVDLTKMKAIDNNIVSVRNAVKPLLSHPHLALILAYGSSDSGVINFLASFMANIFKIPVKIVRNQEQALEYLISQNPIFKLNRDAILRALQQEEVV